MGSRTWCARSRIRTDESGHGRHAQSLRRILPVELAQQLIQLRLPFPELQRPLEERFRRHREELGLVGGAVVVEYSEPSLFGVRHQIVIVTTDDGRPITKRGR